MLTLPIEAQWFNMIRTLEKWEEYRADTPYYAARFARYEGQAIRVRLRNGYRVGSPTLEDVVVPRRQKGAKPEWGGDPDKVCWVLEILAVRDVTAHGTAQV